MLQLVFATVAGAGTLVALTVAYRREKIAEADSVHDRTRVFNERFTTIAAQLGDAQLAARLAGVHAMAGLADDWKQNRQTCVDVLCAYLRLPYNPDPSDDADPAERTAYRANRKVRHTIIRLIGAHLRFRAAVSWRGLNFDFTGVVFDGGDFGGAGFSGGTVDFNSSGFALLDMPAAAAARFAAGVSCPDTHCRLPWNWASSALWQRYSSRSRSRLRGARIGQAPFIRGYLQHQESLRAPACRPGRR